MNRLEILKDRESRLNDFNSQISQELKDFQQIGKKLSGTTDGKLFFSLAKKIYYDQTEYMLDNFYFNDPSQLARLNGEDYILRKVILQFIAHQDSTDSAADDLNINNTNKKQ
jgi:hypothetical protein